MAYQVHLSQFDGPLDLLLHLVSKSKLDIHDIPLAQLTGQYMQYMEQLDQLDMDTASEFLAIAATLLEIKSRSLLPRPEPPAQEDGEDPEETLRRRLIEYQMFKQGSEAMRQMEEGLKGTYYKLPEELVVDTRVEVLAGATAEQLCQAFLRALRRQRTAFEPPPPRLIERDQHTVSAKIRQIGYRLRLCARLLFSELFDGEFTRGEMVATFLALLEMLRSNQVRASQSALFDEIVIESCRQEERTQERVL